MKEDRLAFKKQKKKCVSLGGKSITIYLKGIADKGLKTNKEFWKLIETFLTNKEFLESNLKRKTGLIIDEAKHSEDLNDYYVNIENRYELKPNILGNKGLNDKEEIRTISLLNFTKII